MMQDRGNLTSGNTWVLVADASHADIYSRRKPFGALELVQTLDEPDARKKESELIDGAPGRVFDSGGQGRHSMEPAHSEKDQLLGSFAQSIGDAIESARSAGEFSRLVLIASPRLLGELRKRLSDPTRRCVTLEIDKNVTGETASELAALIDRQRE